MVFESCAYPKEMRALEFLIAPQVTNELADSGFRDDIHEKTAIVSSLFIFRYLSWTFLCLSYTFFHVDSFSLLIMTLCTESRHAIDHIRSLFVQIIFESDTVSSKASV